MMIARHLTPPGLLAALAIALGSEGLRADSVEMVNGTRFEDKVSIVSATHEAVLYKIGNQPQPTRVDANRVASISRDSTLLQAARGALESGDIARALKDFTSIAGGAGNDWQTAEAAYQIGVAYRLGGKPKEAETAFKAYIEKYRASKDWFIPFATSGIGECLIDAKQPGTAEIHFKDLESFGGQWALQSKLGQGMAILLSKHKVGAAAARALFDEVARSSGAPLALKNRALVWRAKSLVEQDNPKQAVKDLEDAFFSSAKAGEIDYSAERAEATLLMGRATALLGGKENLEEAEIWLLRVSALYRKQAAVYALACDALADVYEKLGNQARSDEWKARKTAGPPAVQVQAPAAAPSPKEEAKPEKAAPPPKKAPNGKK